MPSGNSLDKQMQNLRQKLEQGDSQFEMELDDVLLNNQTMTGDIAPKFYTNKAKNAKNHLNPIKNNTSIANGSVKSSNHTTAAKSTANERTFLK